MAARLAVLGLRVCAAGVAGETARLHCAMHCSPGDRSPEREAGGYLVLDTPQTTDRFGNARPMVDPHGRHVTYLRVSVTDRCDFRCVYCMSEHMTFLPKKDLLTLEELDRLCSAFVARGVRKLRLTGGEPLGRRSIMTLVRSLSRHLGHGLDELTLTTHR